MTVYLPEEETRRRSPRPIRDLGFNVERLVGFLSNIHISTYVPHTFHDLCSERYHFLPDHALGAYLKP